jgi:small-conductance mechanosensitive channel
MSEIFSEVTVSFPLVWFALAITLFLLYRKLGKREAERTWLLSSSLLLVGLGVIGLFPNGIQQILLTTLIVALSWSLRGPLIDIFVGILAQRELRQGQWLSVGQLEGQIAKKSWREIFLTTDEGTLMRIPYSVLHEQAFEVSDSKQIILTLPLPEGRDAAEAIELLSAWMPSSPWSKDDNWSVTWDNGIVVKAALFFPSDQNVFQARLFKLLRRDS